MGRILIITDVLPSKTHTAGLVLHQFISQFPENLEVSTYCIHSDGLPTYDVSTSIKGSMRWARKPQETWLAPLFTKSSLELISANECRIISNDILREMSRIKPDEVILVLQGQTMFRIAIQLSIHGIEFSTFHWDPLSWWIINTKSNFKLEKLRKDLLPSLRKGGTHILPSQEYAKYLELPEDKYLVFHLAHSEFRTRTSREKSKIRIAFSGQTYAKKEINFFLKVMDSKNWSIDGNFVELHVYGNDFLLDHNSVIHHGWISPDLLVEELSQYDAGLLPYPSEDLFQEVSRFSFPSKYSTYLAADLPVIFIGSRVNPFTSSESNTVLQVEIDNELTLIKMMKSVKDFKAQGTDLRRRSFERTFSRNAQQSVVNLFLSSRGIHEIRTQDSSLRMQVRNSRSGEQLNYSPLSLMVGRFLYKICFLTFFATRRSLYRTVSIFKRLIRSRRAYLGGFFGKSLLVFQSVVRGFTLKSKKNL